MEAPHLQLTVSENELTEGAKKILSQLRRNWNLENVRFKVFTDGITNKLLGCFNANEPDDVILIRVYGNKTDLLIDRKAETQNIKLLHEAGLAPKLYATFANGLAYEYVPGNILTTENCRLEETYVLVAQTLADMHCVDSNGKNQGPILWDKCTQFLNLVPDTFTDPAKQKRFDEILPSKAKLQEEYEFLKKHLSVIKSPSVFCHNDLLLGNVVYNQQRKTVTFIDYEYAAYNYQAFDIANHFNEYAGVETVDYNLYPDEAYQKRWLTIYLEKYKRNKGETGDISIPESDIQSLYDHVQKFTLASHYFWGIWALIQSEHSSIDFDFLNYAFIRISEYFNRKKRIFDC